MNFMAHGPRKKVGAVRPILAPWVRGEEIRDGMGLRCNNS